MTTFHDLSLNDAVLRGVEREGFTEPTAIQAALIPPMMAGRDCVGLSQTGSGKTAAFILPILNKIAEEEQAAGPKFCRALVVAPTRELAMQIVDVARALSKYSKPRIALLIGGTSYTTQIKAMERGADLVIATPGRLIDHLESGYLGLHRTHVIVLDEADQMMDMGFMPAVRTIMEAMPDKRQTVLLSATMPKPIRKLANDFLDAPFETEVSPQSKPVERIEQHVYAIKSRDRKRALLALVQGESVERGIIFTRTKRTADGAELLLRQAGIPTFALHGDKTKGERNRALSAFKKGEIPVLVATDIAARGIDVNNVSHVINYEMPNLPEAYVHRVGRTARAGKDGVALSLCAPAENSNLRDIERLTGLKFKLQQLSLREVEMPAKDADPIEPPADRRPKGRRYADDKKRADAGAEADPVLGRGWAVKPGRTKKPEQPEVGSDDKPRRARAGGPSRDYESSDEAPYRPRRAGGEGQARAGRKPEAATDKKGFKPKRREDSKSRPDQRADRRPDQRAGEAAKKPRKVWDPIRAKAQSAEEQFWAEFDREVQDLDRQERRGSGKARAEGYGAAKDAPAKPKKKNSAKGKPRAGKHRKGQSRHQSDASSPQTVAKAKPVRGQGAKKSKQRHANTKDQGSETGRGKNTPKQGTGRAERRAYDEQAVRPRRKASTSKAERPSAAAA